MYNVQNRVDRRGEKCQKNNRQEHKWTFPLYRQYENDARRGFLLIIILASQHQSQSQLLECSLK